MLYTIIKNLNDNLKLIFDKTKADVKKQERMKNILKLHHKMCDVQDLFNEALGFPILVFCGMVTLQFLQTLNFILEYKLRSSRISINATIAEVLISAAITVILILSTFTIAICTNRTKKENQHTFDICQQSLIDLPTVNRNTKLVEFNLREGVLQLKQQLKYRHPHFTAANCFIVDITIISRIIGMVLSYAVILLQFN
ncbi:hypothetical protein RN001_004942 [Aquatica leii]|uniref:Gustatory receptor n=1 Tax=Aquatica leii TaxID=1421715 RepID=A0AAN7SPQ0_9COLE|nr:hypothetical protein RN001_004942 [Aquatica leii]